LLAALVWQGTRGTLVEPSRKRASFLEVAKAAMGLLEVEIRAPSGDISAERVLSRATFSAGRRGKLVGYALSAGSVGVWGHHHDVPTWNSEVATWGWQPDKPLGYRVPGLEERCILRASAVRGA
jgi:16S rRNA G527 N7-methylase RsmG